MRLFLLLVLLVVACDDATAPSPGCTLERDIRVDSVTTLTMRLKYDDCSTLNLDSLRAEGWRVK